MLMNTLTCSHSALQKGDDILKVVSVLDANNKRETNKEVCSL